MSERQFRRYRDRYEEDGVEGIRDGRLGKPSPKRVPACVGEPRFKAFGERPPHSPTARWSILYRLRSADGRTLALIEPSSQADRAFKSNLSAGTHLGVRNLAPKQLGRKETTWNYLQC